MLLQTDPDEFRRTVRLALNGGNYRGVKYDRVLSIPGKASGASKQHMEVTCFHNRTEYGEGDKTRQISY